jgi:hypothetical protein
MTMALKTIQITNHFMSKLDLNSAITLARSYLLIKPKRAAIS